jgi:sugar O-acyltransferase (sialic acid O-acetyltransferase NeuD family)
MNNKIIIVGAGGHAKIIIDSLLSIGSYDIKILDDKKINQLLLGCLVEYGENDLNKLKLLGYNSAFVAIGSIGDITIRKKFYDILKKKKFRIPIIIDPSAMVSKYSTIGEGVYIGKGSIVNSDSKIGKMSIINSGSIIEHDVSIGEFVHVSPGSTILGNCIINNNTHIGANSVIKQGLSIGFNSLIGIGSVVTKDIGDNILAYGNPTKEVK